MIADRSRVAALLERDRVWCAYALADLYPPFDRDSTWRVGENAVVLTYAGLSPPVLFAHGDPQQAAALLAQVTPGRYGFALQPLHRPLLGERLEAEVEDAMWRMVLPEGQLPEGVGEQAISLGPEDLPAMEALFAGRPDRPDAFQPRQLEQGIFYGVHRGGALLAVACTHVLSAEAGVAALGNVFTHPDYRRQGLAREASAAVVRELLKMGIRTIVLNVKQENTAAVKLYRGLGFRTFCGYHEGVGVLRERATRNP